MMPAYVGYLETTRPSASELVTQLRELMAPGALEGAAGATTGLMTQRQHGNNQGGKFAGGETGEEKV